MEDLLPLLFLIFWVIVGTATKKKKKQAGKAPLPPTAVEKNETDTKKDKTGQSSFLSRFKEGLNSIKEEIRESVEKDLPADLHEKRKTDYTRKTEKASQKTADEISTDKDSAAADQPDKETDKVKDVLSQTITQPKPQKNPERAIPHRKSKLQNAVLWAEILGKPKALRNDRETGMF